MTLERKVTSDGSITYYNTDVSETYHSTSGAYDEAMRKYAGALDLKGLAKSASQIRILDICFGLGYNSAAAIDVIRGVSETIPIEVIGLEIDPTILSAIPTLSPSFDSFPLLQEAIERKTYDATSNTTSLRVILGDATKTIQSLDDRSFDAILLDPFSPKKAPELWTLPFFREIYRITKNGGRLATYSCARSVRDNLKEAGFRVTDGPCVGRRSPATLAYKEVQ
jgi:tRNA U34 5-methylaminomethyl-2-thiouridine-forming methyltransferase MnmC